MKWDMEIEEIEAVLEKIWNLHDKLSNAIHSISRAHFLNSIKALKKSDKKKLFNDVGDDNRNGSIYVLVFKIICKMEGIVVRRVIPSDNRCLFNAVGYVMDHDKTKAPELRQENNYSERVMLIYDGLHYDALVFFCCCHSPLYAYAINTFKEMDIGSLDIGDFLAIGAMIAATDSVRILQVLSQDETPLLYSMVFGVMGCK
ncbi:hypothetical protein F3Y22_tig00112215pilonHSYRG00109 [Hibiscus syriacus]|uniref:Ubiquitin thioesterase OTU n=1 Tax=Hibiscus syriacus TaxID=106335 RepID=A0A6A2XSJ8_HIBSY|nr:hypothetical protein F3Y22_tig00112215pilonHSYRG00109 [Hibiscus syriacus]